MLDVTALPPELWQLVVDNMSSADKRACLKAFRFLHTLALRSLFSTIHLHFGCWEDFDPWLSDQSVLSDKDYDRIDNENAEISCGIVSRIMRDPSFAALVKTMHVYMFVRKVSNVQRRKYNICSF